MLQTYRFLGNSCECKKIGRKKNFTGKLVRADMLFGEPCEQF